MKPTPTSTNGLLSPRQKQIVTLLADDLTSKEIGDRMGVSPKTVEFHRALIRQRLGVAGTAGIVRYAIRTGLVQP
jgi:DNA-binding CsgD family transcriptional regulator